MYMWQIYEEIIDIYIYVYRVGLFPFQAIVATRIVTFLPLLLGRGTTLYMCASDTLDTLAFLYSPQYIYQTPAYQNSPLPKTHSPSQNLKS